MAEFNQIVKYLKRNDRNLYNQYKDCITNPIVLVNRLVRYYQWFFEIRDFTRLDLQDRQNKNYLNLFLYAMENDAELVNNFINYFTFSLRNAFDYNKRTWNIDLIFNILIHQSSNNEFDLVAMYILMAATFDRFIKFFQNFECKEKLMMSPDEVFELFLLIVNQEFYNDLKHEIINKRKNSFYHKKPDIEIKLPLKENDLIKLKKVEALKKAQTISENEFKKWDQQEALMELYKLKAIEEANDVDAIEQNNVLLDEQKQTLETNNFKQESLDDFDLDEYINHLYKRKSNYSSAPKKSVNKTFTIDEQLSVANKNNDEWVEDNKFKPNPNIKIIKIRRY